MAPTGGTVSREAGFLSIGIPAGSLGPPAPGALAADSASAVGRDPFGIAAQRHHTQEDVMVFRIGLSFVVCGWLLRREASHWQP